MALKSTPNGQTDTYPEYEMLANGNPGKKLDPDPKKNVIRIQENPLAEVMISEKAPFPNDTVRVNLERPDRSRCGLKLGYRTTFELFLSVTIAVLGLICCILFYMIFLHTERTNLNICLTQECVKTAASLLNAMDQTVDPCEDFFRYACGTWNKLHMIPQDKSSISTFEVMSDDLQVILKGLLEEPANNYDNSATIKAKTFYKSCMSPVQIEAIGDKPLRDVIKELGGWPVAEREWVEPEWPIEHLFGKLKGDYNQGVCIEIWVGADDKNSSVNVIQLDQMPLGLPSREYFLKDSSERERKAYLKLMVEVAILFGADREIAEIDMVDVLDLETKIANATAPEADRHDTGAMYNKMSLAELSERVPEFDWVYYLNIFMPTKVDDEEEVVVYAISYLQELGQILSQANRRVVHNYAIWRFVDSMLPLMNGEYSQRKTEFKKVLYGISAESERWSNCVTLVNKKMGMAVGTLFIRENFDPKSKEIAQEMILNIREAFNELLEENTWMDEETRQVAKEKANAMNERIGYPELLKNPFELSKEYEELTIHDDLFLVNVLNVLEFEALKNLKRLRQPVNKNKWTTFPAVVNAFYNPNKNDIVFPAGILQPLFYSHYFPKSLNYGGIGVVIGHEMTHGFDDKGRQFDKDGNLKQWWNEATVRRFRERAQCIIDQYSSYVLEDIRHNINGKMTQGENIADNGGLKQAYRAYKKWVKRHGQEPLLPGLNLTHDQLFFLNYAQIWCGSMRPEDALSKVRSSVHSPGPIRVLGPLSNSYDFARIYNCPVGSRMNPNKKCSVW